MEMLQEYFNAVTGGCCEDIASRERGTKISSAKFGITQA